MGGRGLTGGARQEDQVGAVVDQADRQGAGASKSTSPLGVKGVTMATPTEPKLREGAALMVPTLTCTRPAEDPFS